MKTSAFWNERYKLLFILLCVPFFMFASASEKKSEVTFTGTDLAGIDWVLKEAPGKLVVTQTFPNGVTVSVETNDIMCNTLESDTQLVTTMDLEISEIYFLFHKHHDKVTNETQFRIQLSQNQRSQLSSFRNVKGDICLSNSESKK